MRYSILRLSLLSLVLTNFPSALTQNPAYEVRFKPTTADVDVLALSTSIHSVRGEDEDVYLAEVSFKKGNTELARLVDSYHGKPIRHAVLEERAHFRMRLTRSPSCDMAASKVYLDAEENIFAPDAREKLRAAASGKIPCYSVDHEATRLAK